MRNENQRVSNDIKSVATISSNSWTSITQRLFVVVGSCFLSAAIVAAFHTVALGLPSILTWSPSVAATACAGFGTSAAVFFALHQFFRIQTAASSQRKLDAACRGIKQAYGALQSARPNRQIAWVNAARLILRSTKLAANLTENDHLLEWRLFVEEWRISFFHFCLADHTYYFGFGTDEHFQENIDIDQEDLEEIAQNIARKRELNIDGYSSTLFGDTVLSERAIKVVYEFTRTYDANDDPILTREPFSEYELEEVGEHHLNGLFAFLKIRRGYHLDGGEVRKREKPKQTV